MTLCYKIIPKNIRKAREKSKKHKCKYELQEAYTYTTSQFPVKKPVINSFYKVDSKKVVAYAGYAWDGASGPAIDTPSCMRGTVIHDVLYQAMRCGQLPKTHRRAADKVLLKILERDGMNRLRRNVWYRAVRVAGGLKWR